MRKTPLLIASFALVGRPDGRKGAVRYRYAPKSPDSGHWEAKPPGGDWLPETYETMEAATIAAVGGEAT